MAGGLFIIDAKWFETLGYYDPELVFYGAENLELSFKVKIGVKVKHGRGLMGWALQLYRQGSLT